MAQISTRVRMALIAQATSVLFVVVIVIALISACNTGSIANKNGNVTVDCKKFTIEEKSTKFEPPEKPLPPDKVHFHRMAHTDWFYSCHVNLDTDEVQRDDTLEACTVRLKVKAVHFQLALPIVIYLPEGASPHLRAHEAGHARMCSIIYDRAPAVAEAAGKTVLGMTFSGMGKTPAEARKMALAQAEKIISQQYTAGTAQVAFDASLRYENLCLQYANDPTMTNEKLADLACTHAFGSEKILLK